MRYFADTAWWIAISRKRDQYHQRALAWYQFIIRSESSIVTTEAVLWEWLNAFCAPDARRIASAGYRRAHEDAKVDVAPFERELTRDAVQLYDSRPDKSWSLTDCISFVVMERRGLSEALTADSDFQQANMKALLLEDPPL